MPEVESRSHEFSQSSEEDQLGETENVVDKNHT